MERPFYGRGGCNEKKKSQKTQTHRQLSSDSSAAFVPRRTPNGAPPRTAHIAISSSFVKSHRAVALIEWVVGRACTGLAAHKPTRPRACWAPAIWDPPTWRAFHTEKWPYGCECKWHCAACC